MNEQYTYQEKSFLKMSPTVFDWYIPKISQDLNEFEAGKILSYIRENNSTAVKTLIIEDLIDCDAKYRIQGSYFALVIIAAQQNKHECVKVLCETGCNLSPQTGNQQSPLIWAIQNQNVEMVKILLKHNVNVNEPCSITGQSPICIAASNRSPEIVKLLVKAGVNMKKTDRFGKSPLLLACHTPNLPTIEFLLENGCDPFCRDNNMNSCIQQICQARPYKPIHVTAIRKLITRMTQKSPNETKKILNPPTGSPLGSLASNWNDTDEEIEILKLLVDNGADPYQRSSIKNMPLMELACTKNHVKLAKFLINMGIILESPLDLLTNILKHGYSDIFNLLTHSFQSINKVLFLLNPEDIEPSLWQKVCECRKNPLTLKNLTRISVMKDIENYDCEDLPKTLLPFLRFEEI